jgi:hypothetical protein
MIRLRGAVAWTAVAGALLVTACGGQGSITSNVKPKNIGASPQISGTLVGIRDGVLIPRHLVVIVGHPVQWRNFDPVARRLVALKGASFRSTVLKSDRIFAWTPHKLGTIHYHDALHPNVTGTIVVTP